MPCMLHAKNFSNGPRISLTSYTKGRVLSYWYSINQNRRMNEILKKRKKKRMNGNNEPNNEGGVRVFPFFFNLMLFRCISLQIYKYQVQLIILTFIIQCSFTRLRKFCNRYSILPMQTKLFVLYETEKKERENPSIEGSYTSCAWNALYTYIYI